MRSTLPILEAERLPDGSVELRKGTSVVMRYDAYRTDVPSRTTRAVQISNTYYRLRWTTPTK